MKATVKPYLLAALLVALSAAALAHAQPDFVYETTVGGFYLSSGRGMAVDGEGNAYVIGSAYADHVHLDVLVIKVGPDGTELWTTYIQGSGHDYATGVALDNAGDVYVTGWTDSDDFPILNAIKETRTHRDAFLMKLASEDGALLFSTYFGGSFSDHGGDIALNGDGEIYLVGYTESLDFPVTDDAIQDELNLLFGLPSDAFVTKLSGDAQTIMYSTYLGGTADDEGRSIGLDANDNIYIAGNTRSDDFPLADPVQPVHAGGFEDVFVARISADGSQLDYSTYLGGEDWDRVGLMAVDAAGNAHVAGITRSIYFPTTPGAFQEDFVGEILGCGQPPFDPLHNCEDVFVTKVAPDGSALEFSTFLAGHEPEEGRGIAVDSDGSVYVVGFTNSDDFPPNGINTAAEIFVSKLSATGSDLLYTVAIDSPVANAGHGIAVDDAGDVYITGAVNVPSDLYVAKLSDGPPGDLNGDGCVGQSDLGIVLADWGCTGDDCPGDIDGDGMTGQSDLGIVLANWGAGCDEVVTIALQLEGIEDLGPDYVYEGWFIVDGMPVSTGRFVVDENGMAVPGEFQVDTMDAADATLFVLTIEPAEGDDPAPADTHYLAGEWNGAMAAVLIGHPAALGDDFTSATGAFILETPSTGGIPEDYDQGIWWLDPNAGPGPSLVLPELPAGWAYEGWVVGGDGPITTGRFLSVSGADSDGAGPTAGPDPAPPFPGQDYIDPPIVLTGFAAVISIEPEPDNSPAPFTLKPLIDGSIADVGPGVLQSMGNHAADAPTGMVTLVE